MASSKLRRLTDADILAQVPGAIASEKADRAAGLRAVSARYDKRTERVVLELSNGLALAFPASMVYGLEQATHAQRADLELDPAGAGVIWDALDSDISVPGLISSTFGRRDAAKVLGKAGGSSKSDAKSAAARTNGVKGGRPRKTSKERRSAR